MSETTQTVVTITNLEYYFFDNNACLLGKRGIIKFKAQLVFSSTNCMTIIYIIHIITK